MTPFHQPIGVFDSGLGGLTVLAALRTRLPGEDFIYFADTHFLPYGEKPEAFIQARGQAIAQALVERGAKAIVVACNTATAAAAELIRAAIPKPVVALEPAVKPAAALTRSGVVGVLATTRTLASQRYQRLVQTHAESVRVISQPCPGLAWRLSGSAPVASQEQQTRLSSGVLDECGGQFGSTDMVIQHSWVATPEPVLSLMMALSQPQ